ncbi:hypothetical protein HS088_TW22G00605 [Tripterygium wilfordii]|uniref:Uncharacterized protein n=1 Tax=Tripterygium wilfordii TaxID=458696 RepID=A0A7J7BYE4_TRIWF|nr:uncharacterized protein At1g15400-like [Tripterygium wilfordii]KAF5726920.1 hypothetical protein HS088_TW22G00605 [Tripterygium wilfordii]
MAGLQRSAISFRRQGSSGIVFDDRILTGEVQIPQSTDRKPPQEEQKEVIDAKDMKPARPTISTIDRSRSNGGGRGYRTGKASPAVEPPSPRISACGCFGNTGKSSKRPRAGKRRSR